MICTIKCATNICNRSSRRRCRENFPCPTKVPAYNATKHSPYCDCTPRWPERRNPLVSQRSAPCCRSPSGCSVHTRSLYKVQPSSPTTVRPSSPELYYSHCTSPACSLYRTTTTFRSLPLTLLYYFFPSDLMMIIIIFTRLQFTSLGFAPTWT